MIANGLPQTAMAPSSEKRAADPIADSTCLNESKACARAEAWGKEGHSYKPLPTQFRHDGFEYRQIARERDAAIYKQRWGGCADPSVSYEVIRIRRREGFQIGARLVEAAEVYPNSEAWGMDGFTLTDRDAAFAKLQELRIASGAVGP